jgi:hypothetical protein
MTVGVLAVIAVASALALMWSVPRLPPAGVVPPQRVAVVIPARNEARRLPHLLAGLAAQTHPADRVVVVDDLSEDDTAAVAHGAGAAVVASGGPPAGWTGKAWACHCGVEAAVAGGTDLLVLLDADVRLAPDALERLRTGHAMLAPDGLLSVQPYHETARVVEQLSAVPNIVAVMASGMAALRAPRTGAVAFGPCLVTTPAALADAGGFEAVRADAIEDIALAHRFGDRGRTVRCVAGRGTVAFRMYEEGARALAEGWTKNLAGGARRAAAGPVAGAVAWVAGAAAVAVEAVLRPSPLSVLLWLVIAAQMAWMLRRLGRFQVWTSVLFPVPLAAFIGLFAGSVIRRGVFRSVTWRGREIPVAGS